MITPNAWQTRTPTAEAYLDEGLRQHMLRVYNYMGVGLVLTGIVASFSFCSARRAGRMMADAGKPEQAA